MNVMSVVPSPTAVTRPVSSFTVATVSSLEIHNPSLYLSSALAGKNDLDKLDLILSENVNYSLDYELVKKVVKEFTKHLKDYLREIDEMGDVADGKKSRLVFNIKQAIKKLFKPVTNFVEAHNESNSALRKWVKNIDRNA